MPFQRVLVPSDYSAPYLAVISFFDDTARHYSTDLTLVHAYGPGTLALTRSDLPKAVDVIEQKRLGVLAYRRVQTVAELGEPDSAIKELIRKQRAYLMATPGDGHAAHLDGR